MKVTVNIKTPENAESETPLYNPGALFTAHAPGSPNNGWAVMLCQLGYGKFGFVGINGNRFTSNTELSDGGHPLTLDECTEILRKSASCQHLVLTPFKKGTVVTLTVE